MVFSFVGLPGGRVSINLLIGLLVVCSCSFYLADWLPAVVLVLEVVVHVELGAGRSIQYVIWNTTIFIINAHWAGIAIPRFFAEPQAWPSI